ncbi:MAG: HlyD family efflux transporter periplasmic adaptor subunit [Phycisphaerales bacterium]|jgi:HlyD family secretion protein|nr:HlyD family efflux transporter periplasmic adaptor subunit [Phycisphaerales bacterium]
MHRLEQHIRRGVSTTSMMVGAGALAIIIIISLMAGGGGSADDIVSETDLHDVVAGNFEITIPASGVLEAKEMVELRSGLDGTATIMEIIPEGTSVTEGQVLVRLDDKDVRDRIESAQEKVVEAENRVETRAAELEIAQKARESSLAKAAVAIDQAKLAKLAWEEGQDVTTRNQLALTVRTAEKDFKRLEEKYAKSVDLRARDFISQNDLEQDEINMIRAEAALSRARLEKEVYEKYTYKKDKQARESDLKQAEEEQVRIDTRTQATVKSSTSNLETAHANLESRRERLVKLQQQLEACTVQAPSPGMVVYGTTIHGDRRGNDESFRVGSKVSRNQLLMVLPNTEFMIAVVKVNEALSGSVKPGQLAILRMDAFPETILDGNVIAVGVLAEDGGWRDPNRREYSVRLSIDNPDGLQLKPSMRCTAEIQVDEVSDVLHVPVQAVHRSGRSTIVYTMDDGLFRPTPVTLGRSSSLYVEVLDGLTPGAQVLLRDPPPGTAIDLDPEQESVSNG